MVLLSQLAWMAGVVDVRGRLVVKSNRQRKTRQFVMTVSSKDLDLIRALSNLTGTQPEIRSERMLPEWMRKGCVEHCPDAHVHVPYQGGYPMAGVWAVTGVSMVTVVSNIAPFLLHNNYIEASEETLETAPLIGKGSGMTLYALRRLRDLGWELPEKYATHLEEIDERAASDESDDDAE